MSSTSINKSGAGYTNSSNYNEQVCSSQAEEELVCSAPPPEELVCKGPEDKTKVKPLPKGKADKPVVFFDDSIKSSNLSKSPVCSTASITPEAMVCSEENYLSEPEPQNASPVEADMNVNLTDNKIKASGNITLRREFVQKAVEDTLKSNDKIENAKITFDSKTNSYKVTGKYNPDYLPKQNFELTLKPTIENQKLGLKLDSDDYWGVFNNTIGEKIAEKVSSNGVITNYNSNSKVISFDTDSILQKTDAIHYSTKTDLSKNEISFSTNSIGDISLGLHDPDVQSPINKTSKSDVVIKMDKPSLSCDSRLIGIDCPLVEIKVALLTFPL